MRFKKILKHNSIIMLSIMRRIKQSHLRFIGNNRKELLKSRITFKFLHISLLELTP